jgi:hypothetical protein
MSALSIHDAIWLRQVFTVAIGVFAFVSGFLSLHVFLRKDFPKTRADFVANRLCVFILFLWTFGPPAWFFFEYVVLWAGDNFKDIRVDILNGQKLAQSFWAAILATLLFLIPK